MMEVAMEGEEAESTRHERVKELEAIVLQLEKENKKLLNKVTESEEKYRDGAGSSAARRRGRDGDKLANAMSTEDLISLDAEMSEANEDEWLFVSPAKPPTPSQKRLTPSQWLERGGVATTDDPLFSLDEVRKDLSFQISNAEGLSPSNVRRTPGGRVSPLTAKKKLSNPTAQRYLNQVRERKSSPPVELTAHSLRGGLSSSVGGGEEEEAVPVVRWKRPVMPESATQSMTEGDEAVPVVRWKRPVMPESATQSMTEGDEAVPVVRWKRPVMPESATQPMTEGDKAVPVVRWKRPVMPESATQSMTEGDEAVPVVRWKRPVMPEPSAREEREEEEAVPVVRWKKPVLPQTEEEDDIPVVRWKKPVIPQDSHSSVTEEAVPVVRWRKPVIPPQTDLTPPPLTEEEVVPTVKWKRPVLPQDNPPEEALNAGLMPRQQRNVPIKAISTSARSPPEGEEEEEVIVHQSNTLPRASARRSLGSGGLKPPPGSPSSRQRNASAERTNQRQPQTLRSRSPSPSLRQPATVESSSPSPTLTHTSRLSVRTSGRPHPSPSPPRSSSLQPPSSGGKQSLVKTPSAPGSRKLPTPPSSGSRGRVLPPSYSTPTSAGPGVTTQSGFTPPSPGIGRQQGVTPPRVGVPRPQMQLSPQRGGLTPSGTPRVMPGSQIRPARNTPNNRQQRKVVQPQRKPMPAATSYEDDWLEGCF